MHVYGKSRVSIVICILIISIISSSILVFASSSVSITTFGGDDKNPAGFTLQVTNLSKDDKIKVEVSKGDVGIQTFIETPAYSVLSKRIQFTVDGIVTGNYTFKTYVNDIEINTQNAWIYLGTGSTDSNNGGRITAKLNKEEYTVGGTATLTALITNIEEYATEPAKFTVTGKGVTESTGIGVIDIEKAFATSDISIVFTDPTIKTLNISASWGQKGYTRAIDIPVRVKDNNLTPPLPNIFNLTVGSGTGGTVSGSGNYKAGDIVNIEAKPNSNYKFLNWKYELPYGTIHNVNTAKTTFTMPENASSITAQFERINETKDTYTLKVKGTTGGTVDGGGTYEEGERVYIEAFPKKGYEFEKWTSSNSDGDIRDKYSEDTYYIMPDSNVTLTANFIDEDDNTDGDNKLTVKASTGGRIVGNPDGYYDKDKKIDIEAKPDSGYKFVNWEVSYGELNSTTDIRTRFTMPNRNATITANFESDKYTLTVNTINGSTTSSGKYSKDDKVTLNVTPNNGYMFEGWNLISGGGTLDASKSASSNYIMPGNDATISANITLIPIVENKLPPEPPQIIPEPPQIIPEPIIEPQPQPLPPDPVQYKGSAAPLVKTSDLPIGFYLSISSLIALIFVIYRTINRFRNNPNASQKDNK